MLQKDNTNVSNEQVGKASTCTHISGTKYFMEWTSSTQCTCSQSAAAGSEAWRFASLTESQVPHNVRTSVNRIQLMKQQILSHYSGCFEGIGQFPGELYKFYLKPEHKPVRHAPGKVLIHLDESFK